MKTTVVSSRLLSKVSMRLDSKPYTSVGFETRSMLSKLKLRKDNLSDTTAGGKAGIFIAPYFKRNYIQERKYGVPLLGNSHILMASPVEKAPLLSGKTYQKYKDGIQLKEGWTLITCFGTVGDTAYCRKEFECCAGSTNFMRIVPDRGKIFPGYLYAFLSSHFGKGLISQNETGYVITNLLPSQIYDLPVPRFSDSFENEVHELVSSASDGITEHNRLLRKATSLLLRETGLKQPSDYDWFQNKDHLGWSEERMTTESFRSMNYDPRAKDIKDQILSSSYSFLGTLCHPALFKGKIFFKRIDAAPEYGRMLVGQRDAFRLNPEGRWISRKSVDEFSLQVPPGATLVPSHGTLGETELYCRAVYVTKNTSQYAYSGDFFRCIPRSELISPGYLYAFLRSKAAFRMIRSISIGGKQQEQHPSMMWHIPIPRLDTDIETSIASMVDEAFRLYDQSIDSENEARSLVERSIREAV